MIQARVVEDAPTIKGYIYQNTPTIKGAIHADAPFIVGRIKKAIDHAPEPYYEVANEYGTTIIIGD